MKKFLVILLLITFIFLIDGLCILWVKKNDSFLFGATAANALFTLILVFVAWSQLTGIHDTSSSDFIHKLKETKQ